MAAIASLLGLIGFVVSVVMFFCIIGIASSSGESAKLLKEILKELQKESKQ